MNKKCVFCQIIKKESPAEIIFENHNIIAFLDIDPINDGHVLVIPKEHLQDLDGLEENLLCEITKYTKHILKTLNKVFRMEGYSIMHNGGYFDDIGHFHLHIFPRYRNDGFSWTYKSSNETKKLNEVKELLLENI